VTVLVGALVLLAWLPLRQRPGLGTVSNVVVIGVAVDASLAVLPELTALPGRIALAVAGIVLNAVATAAYIGVHLGPGPRDGLMTGLVRRTGGSVRVVRTAIEVGVVTVGWLLGGTLGVATVAYALAIGPLVHLLLPRLSVRLPERAPHRQADAQTAQATQVRAEGRAARRSAAIGRPQTSQTP
jgi:uncharacterized membrane protein YczE